LIEGKGKNKSTRKRAPKGLPEKGGLFTKKWEKAGQRPPEKRPDDKNARGKMLFTSRRPFIAARGGDSGVAREGRLALIARGEKGRPSTRLLQRRASISFWKEKGGANYLIGKEGGGVAYLTSLAGKDSPRKGVTFLSLTEKGEEIASLQLWGEYA